MPPIREIKSGKFELTLAHALLPRRLFFTFDSSEAAEAYGSDAVKYLSAGVVPAGLLAVINKKATAVTESLGQLIDRWVVVGRLSPTDADILGWMKSKDAALLAKPLPALNYAWAESWVADMKLNRVLAPSSIRQRVQAVSRALDWHLRAHPTTVAINPLRLLPRGYSIYSTQDRNVLVAQGEEPRRDIVRDRRLEVGEADRIRAVLSGTYKPTGKERSIPLPDGSAMLVLFETILHTGVRLREAYTIERSNVNALARVVRIKTTKQRNGVVAYRDVPIRPELFKTLMDYIANHPDSGNGLVFPFWDGDPETLTITSNRLSHRFASVFRHARCVELTEHDLRHEATCQWFELRDDAAGWLFRDKEVNKIMGWAPNSSMAARYASFRASALADRLWARVRTATQDSE